MLTTDTKRKIDYLRDVLVGKIPVPSQQIEQITLGLIYKFMSDIDEQNEELGGKSFFAGEYKKYAWKNIMDRSLAGHERVLFYAEGLEKMSRNKELPQLFRDIFKGAFLPFKDPAVLDLFLKGINEFKYEHSEELGNAFEYLLSTAASQGDAGQFRTPRHIIDFIVEVVDPQKEDKILDPACGTAGFLVSAYKHILKNNTDKKSDKAGSLLTSTERKKLTKNIVGYDISHEMVRLSLVNLYLHGFAEPSVYEYDTLSSLERWDDSFDCLLANPPFMTPRGGIKPHNRFPIQANKAEVLFVDYITEHLTPNGKAGIIVPEGIIFQSSGAYKQLRKMLVEDGLWAVVSLPQGVFNPYSGVKTSILFFNNTIARQTKEILFTKIENDGYDLGAQRKPIDKNDLPIRLALLDKYKKAVQENKKFSLSKAEEVFASVVKKEKIAKNGDYNLSANHYLATVDYANVKWPIVKLGEVVIDMKDGGTPARKNEEYFGGNINWCVVKDIKSEIRETAETLTELGVKHSSTKVWPIDTIIISLGATIGNVGIAKIPTATKQGLSGIVVDKAKILPKFLFYILKNKREFIQSLATGVTIKEVRPSKLKELFSFPLPPIETQREIVDELNGYQKITDGANQIVDSYKPVIKIDPSWKMVALSDVVEFNPSKNGFKDNDNLEVSFVPMSDLQEGQAFFKAKQSKKLKEVIKGYTYFSDDDVLLAKITPCFENGKSGISKELTNSIGFGSTEFIVLRPTKNVLSQWIYNFISSDKFLKLGKANMTGSAGQQRLNMDFVKNYKIPLPTIEIQKQIIAKIEEEQKTIEANRELAKLFEKKIKDKISEVWGE